MFDNSYLSIGMWMDWQNVIIEDLQVILVEAHLKKKERSTLASFLLHS